MSIANWLVAITTLIYAGTAIAHWFDEQPGLSIAFAGYALANVGLIIAGMKNV